MKKIISVILMSVVLTTIMTLPAKADMSMDQKRRLIERAMELEPASSVAFADWPLENKLALVDEMEKAGMDVSMFEGIEALPADRMDAALTEKLGDIWAGELGSTSGNIWISLFGPYPAWPLEEKAWYTAQMLKYGRLSDEDQRNELPGDQDFTAEEAVRLAGKLLQEAYGHESGDALAQFTPYVSFYSLPAYPDVKFWEISYQDHDGAQHYKASFRADGSVTALYRMPTPEEIAESERQRETEEDEYFERIKALEAELGLQSRWMLEQKAEHLPQAVQAYIDGSRWSGWEITGWVNPNGLKAKSACAFAAVKNGKQNVLLAFGWGDKGWSYKWYNPAALPQVEEPVLLVDSNTNLQNNFGFTIGFMSYYVRNNELMEKNCIWAQDRDGAWNLFHMTSFDPYVFIDTSKEDAIHYFYDGPVDAQWAYGSYQRDLRYFSLKDFPLTPKDAHARLSDPPKIPSGTLTARKIQFTGGKKYKVYQGPGEEYGQAGKGKAVVSTNDWIQVFGRENDWIMIQYDISSDHMRIGWIKAEALPKNADVPELYFAPIYAAPVGDVSLTDDPLFSQTSVMTIPKGTQIYWLARMGDWAYVEWPGSQPVRGFLKLDHMLDYGVYVSNGASAEEELHVFRMSLPFDPNSWSVEERAAEGDKILELMVKYPGFNENRGYTVYGLPKDGEVSYDRALAFAKEALQAKYGSDGAWHINDYPVTRAAFTRIPYWGDKMPAPNWMFIFGDEVFYQIYITADPSGPSLIVIHDMDNANG